MDSLYTWFPGIKHIRSPMSHQVSHLVEHQWVDVTGQKVEARKSGLKQPDETWELNLLTNVVKKSLEERKSKSIIIFAESKKAIDRICEALRQAEIKSLPYYQDIAVQGRAMTLMLFQNQQLPVIVCNNLAARGLDTMSVSHVI